MGNESDYEMESRMIFASSCVESLAERMGIPSDVMYLRMKAVGMFDKYIFPCYDALHTESRENLTDDLEGCLLDWEKWQKEGKS